MPEQDRMFSLRLSCKECWGSSQVAEDLAVEGVSNTLEHRVVCRSVSINDSVGFVHKVKWVLLTSSDMGEQTEARRRGRAERKKGGQQVAVESVRPSLKERKPHENTEDMFHSTLWITGKLISLWQHTVSMVHVSF